MFCNCYHSQGINKGRQLEQGGFSWKTDLPLSHKKQFPHSLTFIYNFCSIFTIHISFCMPSQWGFLFVFLVFQGQALKLSIIKAKGVLVDEAEDKVLHTFTPLQVLQTLWSNKQARFTLASDLCGLTWLTAVFYNDLLQINIKNTIFGCYSISNSGPVKG